MSNHTHRTIPHPRRQERRIASSWGGGVWQLTILTAVSIGYVAVAGWGKTEAQTAFREAFIFLSSLALVVAVTLQQLRRARESVQAKARH